MDSRRILRANELPPGTAHVCVLPDGWVLIDPTMDELRILEIFAKATPVSVPAETD